MMVSDSYMLFLDTLNVTVWGTHETGYMTAQIGARNSLMVAYNMDSLEFSGKDKNKE